MTAAIELHQVTKRFGNNTAVDAVDLTVPENTIYGFIGPNGSGKTTTIRLILRIFRPDEGRVHVLGRDHGSCADSRLGYLPEERGLYKRMKVRDLLGYYARLKGHYDNSRDIDDWLERLGARDWANRRIDALSKGMAQKVQFIGAVVAKPQLLILDEPFTGLDPVNLEVIRGAILDLQKSGTTIIFSTHDMDVAERMCDAVFMIFRGQKVLDGTISEIKQTYAARRVRLRLANGAMLPTDIPHVEHVEQHANLTWLDLTAGQHAPEVLSYLAENSRLEFFELMRPSLHDIFVQIADPEGQVERETAAVPDAL